MASIRFNNRKDFPLSIPVGELKCGTVFGIGINLYIKTNIRERDTNVRVVNLETGCIAYLSPDLHVIEADVEISVIGQVDDDNATQGGMM